MQLLKAFAPTTTTVNVMVSSPSRFSFALILLKRFSGKPFVLTGSSILPAAFFRRRGALRMGSVGSISPPPSSIVGILLTGISTVLGMANSPVKLAGRTDSLPIPICT